VHQGQTAGLSPYVLGELTGTENVLLNAQQMPSHSHGLSVSNNGTRSTTASSNFLASGEDDIYTNDTASPAVGLNAVVSTNGGNQPHTNIQPALCVNFCIALEGIFPSRN
jgi:microcystin-dependent protein